MLSSAIANVFVTWQSAGVGARPGFAASELRELKYSPFFILLVVVVVAVGLSKVLIRVLWSCLLSLIIIVNDRTDVERICAASQGCAGR